MPRAMNIENLDHIRRVMNLYGTASGTEIHRHLKSEGVKISRTSVHNLIQEIKKSNEGWLDGQAKTTWASKIRELYESKCARLIDLKQERDECTQPRTKAYYAEVITATEASIIELMENQPLYYLWNKRNQAGVTDEENTVIVED